MLPLITLTTDFGEGSPYVAQMKGVILTRHPAAQIVDITHGIPPQHVMQGAVVLDDVVRFFPPGTIHIAVVDPGVGTARELIYAEIGAQRLLAPNNGLLSLLAERDRPTLLIELRERWFWANQVSATFHGRDILAPVAAHLALGAKPAEFGPPLARFVQLASRQPHVAADHILGSVLMADSFGNLITNIRSEALAAVGPLHRLSVRCKDRIMHGVNRTYGDFAIGSLIALLDSQDRLEIALVNGSAQQELQAAEGTEVIVQGNG